MQSTVDCALAAFAAAHTNSTLGFSVRTSGGEALLEAINQGPLPPLEECFEPTAVVLLARAAIHRSQTALGAGAHGA